eukprot:7136845-Prymnesium_polylepis.1
MGATAILEVRHAFTAHKAGAPSASAVGSPPARASQQHECDDLGQCSGNGRIRGGDQHDVRLKTHRPQRLTCLWWLLVLKTLDRPSHADGGARHRPSHTHHAVESERGIGDWR